MGYEIWFTPVRAEPLGSLEGGTRLQVVPLRTDAARRYGVLTSPDYRTKRLPFKAKCCIATHLPCCDGYGYERRLWRELNATIYR